MSATLTKDTLNTVPVNAFDASISFEIEFPGASRSREALELAFSGQHNLVISAITIETPGTSKQFESIELEAGGTHNRSTVSFTIETPGTSSITNTFENSLSGVSGMSNEIELGLPGLSSALEAFEVTASGAFDLDVNFEIVAAGAHLFVPPERTRTYEQYYRVADDSLERWELYVGEDEMPDFDDVGQPVATGTSLPINWTTPVPGAGETITLYVVPRKRNKFNLLSHSQHPTLIEIDETVTELGHITAPFILLVLDEASGSIQVFCRYDRGHDRNPADTWRVYAEDGVDPDPDVHTEKTSGSIGVDLVAYQWKTIIESLTPGSTYHVLIELERVADGGTTVSTVTQFTLAEVFDLDGDETSMFGGEKYEIGQ